MKSSYPFPLNVPLAADMVPQVLGHYLEGPGLQLARQQWLQHQFELVITRPRKSRYGTCIKRGNHFTITLNANLTKPHFIITYLHEVAHLIDQKDRKRPARAHGPSWQRIYRELIEVGLSLDAFPYQIVKPLKASLANVKSATGLNEALAIALGMHQEGEAPTEGTILLKELKAGDVFIYGDRHYVLLTNLRSTMECQEANTGQLVRIRKTVAVKPDPSHGPVAPPQGMAILDTLPIGARFRYRQHVFLLKSSEKRVVLANVQPSMREYRFHPKLWVIPY